MEKILKSVRLLKRLLLFLVMTFILLYTFATEDQSFQKSSLPKIVVQATADIIVNTTSDVADFAGAQQVGDLPGLDGVVSLREAIIAANNTLGPQVIWFNIPTSDDGFNGTVFTIQPLSSLPALSDDFTTIDGTTQTSFSGDTNESGPEVVLNGDLTPTLPHTPGFWITGFCINSSGNIIRGLVINGFEYGVFFFGSVSNNLIEDNFIGVDSSGTQAVPNQSTGIFINGMNNLIRRNLISGNREIAIEIYRGSGHRIEGNLIGTDVTGTNPLPNRAGGISIESNNNFVGGLLPGQANVIAFNSTFPVFGSGDGISIIKTAVNNRISGNSIFSNYDLGIDLGVDYHGDGLTLNDPSDLDFGPNNLQNYPVLTSALATPGKLIVKGTIDTPSPKTVIIEFFTTEPGGDPSGHGEGAVFLGTVRPNKKGKFTATLRAVPAGTLITATATDADGNTSEFAKNIEAKFPLK